MGIPKNDKRKYLENRIQFQNLSRDADFILRKYGIRLNFRGIVETLVAYMRYDGDDLETLKILIRDLNSWVAYLGQVKALVHHYELFFESELLRVSDEKLIIEFKNKHFIMKQYGKALNRQRNTFLNSYNDCIENYKELIKDFYI